MMSSLIASPQEGGVEGEGANLPVDAGVVAGQPREVQDRQEVEVSWKVIVRTTPYRH